MNSVWESIILLYDLFEKKLKSAYGFNLPVFEYIQILFPLSIETETLASAQQPSEAEGAHLTQILHTE